MHIVYINFSVAMLKVMFTTPFSKASDPSKTKEEESYISLVGCEEVIHFELYVHTCIYVLCKIIKNFKFKW